MPLAAIDQSTPPVSTKPHRRHSDRVRSPSDSSGSESDEAARLDHPAPAPRVLASGIPRPVARRNKHSSSAAPETPVAARSPTHAPSSFSPFGAFARPSPMNRRRRGSMRSPTPEAEEDHPSFDQPVRHPSSSSIGRISPSWSGQGNATSPTAPQFDFETRPYHRGMTPEQGDDEDAEEAGQSDDDAEEEFDRVEEDLRRANDSLNPRLSRISVRPIICPRTPLINRPNPLPPSEHRTTSFRLCKSRIPSWAESSRKPRSSSLY